MSHWVGFDRFQLQKVTKNEDAQNYSWRINAGAGCWLFNFPAGHELTNSLVPPNLSEQDVSRAIINAGVSKTWIMREERPGLITGHIQVRQHQANISIPYNTTNYSINYVSSVNLNDKGKGKIHRTYNRWINGLNQEIQLELKRASSNK